MSAKHSEQTVATGIHQVYAFEYADASARNNATGLTSADIGKVARQVDNGSFWILQDDSPLTWKQLGEIGATSVPLNRVVWVDAVNGSGAGAPGDIATAFDTISGALTAAAGLTPTADNQVVVKVMPGSYTEPPLTIPSYVVVRSEGQRRSSTIVASTPTSPLITGSAEGSLLGFRLTGANGVGGCGVRMASVGQFWMNDVEVSDCTCGVISDGSGGVVLNCISVAVVKTPGLVGDAAFSALNGGRIVGQVISIVGVGATFTDGFVCDGSGSEGDIQVYFSTGCVDAVHVSNSGDLTIASGTILDSTNAIHINGTGGMCRMELITIKDSATWDVLIDSSSGSLRTSSVTLDGSKVSLTSGSSWIGTWINTIAGDEGVDVEGELHVGSHLRPAEATFGGGDSHVRGLSAFTNTNVEAGTWTDISTEIASGSGSTVSILPGVTTGSTFYLGGDVEFPGIKISPFTPLVIGAGNIEVEYWNGSSWIAFQWMTTDSDTPYNSYGNALLNSASSMQMRFGEMTGWAARSLNGVTKFWVRFRVSSNITTVAVVEQMKLHTDRCEINADGWIEYFGSARPQRTIDINTNTFQSAGGSPGNQDIAYGANLQVGHSENSFANNAVDQGGISLQLPPDFDTSFPLKLDIEWQTSSTNTGDCTWYVYYVTHEPEVVLAHAIPGPLTEKLSTVTTAAPGVSFKGQVVQHLLSIPEAITTAQWSLVVMVRRDGTSDAFTGVAVIRNIRLRGVVWNNGQHRS